MPKPAHRSPRLQDADRSRRQCHQGHRRRAQRAARRHLRALSEDQEFPLAHERAAFPRLPPAARRARRPDLRHDRRARRARAQDRRQHPALDRRHLAPAAHRRQRRGLCRAARHAGRAARGQPALRRRRCARRTTSATSTATSPRTSLLENYIDEAERRVWFLYEAAATAIRPGSNRSHPHAAPSQRLPSCRKSQRERR